MIGKLRLHWCQWMHTSKRDISRPMPGGWYHCWRCGLVYTVPYGKH